MQGVLVGPTALCLGEMFYTLLCHLKAGQVVSKPEPKLGRITLHHMEPAVKTFEHPLSQNLEPPM